MPRRSTPRTVNLLAAGFWLAAGFAAPAGAQTSFNASFHQWVRAGAEAAGEAGAIRDASVALDHEMNDTMRLFYALDAGTLAAEGDWSFMMHQAGLVLTTVPRPASGLSIFTGMHASARSNGASWGGVDYIAFSGFANLQWHRSAASALRAGYRLDARRFGDTPALDQREHSGFVSAVRNVQRTRTTVIAEVTAGAKSYEGSEGDAQQVAVLGRVAQAITARTGLAIEFSGRNALGSTPPELVALPVYLDDVVYDDPFASDMRSWRLAGTRELGRAGTLRVSAATTRKAYAAAVRVDDIRAAVADWSVPLSREGVAFGVRLDIGYRFLRQSSNDLFYDYTSHAVTTGIAIAY